MQPRAEARDAGPLTPAVHGDGGRLVPEGIARIAAGTRQSCALDRTGRVLCWGGHGLVVEGGHRVRHRPVVVPGIDDGLDITAGDAHVCALRRSGGVACWGRNVEGQLGDGTRAGGSVPVAVRGLRDAVAVSAGGQHTCAVRRGGAVVCFGENREGQLGDGTTRAAAAPVEVVGLRDATRISAGPGATCALRRSGSVVCWGSRGSGVFGVLDAEPALRPTPVAALSNAIEVVTGHYTTCVIDRERTMVCVGQNHDGRISPDRSLGTILATPQRPLGRTRVRAIALLTQRTCVLDGEGAVRCWAGDARWTRTTIEALRVGDDTTRFEELSGFYDHICGSRADGAVSCLGQNYEGQLGRESGTDRRTPVAVPMREPIARVVASSNVVCARTVAGRLFCWGYDVTRDARRSMGPTPGAELGGPPGGVRPPPFFESPVPPASVGIVRDVIVGESFVCAVDANGGLGCLGDNTHGQLGDPNPGPQPLVAVRGVTAVRSASGWGHRACAVHGAAGDVSCWGAGANADGSDSGVPVRRAELRGAVEVAVGAGHVCAVVSDGGVRCWGDRSAGQLGDGSSGADAGISATSVSVQSLPRAAHVVAGGHHSCAITHDSEVWCWGAGYVGQLGHGERGHRASPTRARDLRSATRLAAGSAHTCAVTRDGSLYCWGRGSSGELGVGSSDDQLAPVRVSSLSGVTDVAAGEGFTCAVHGEPAQVSCWGASRGGVLGTRFTPGPSDPVMSSGAFVTALW